MRKLLLILALCGPLFAQITRVDPTPAFTVSTNVPPGANAPVLTLPGATIALCADLACATAAISFTDATGSTTCPVNVPVTLGTSTACSSTADNNGNFGFWLMPGQYWYTITKNGSTSGPFPLTASTTASNVPIGVASPLYLFSHFRDDDDINIRIDYSRDATNWTPIGSQGTYAPPDGIFRDPSIMYVPASGGGKGTFHLVYDSLPSNDCSVEISTSTDLINYTYKVIDLRPFFPSCQTAWAPEFFHDPVSGNYYIYDALGNVAIPVYNSPKYAVVMQYFPATATIGTPQTVSMIGTTQSNIFDLFPYYYNGQYYLFYVDQQAVPTVTQPIAYATGSGLGGPFMQQTPPGADYFGFGNNFQTEAPTLIPIGTTGCVRIMVDTWIYPQLYSPQDGHLESIGRQYKPSYRDSCSAAGALFTPASLVNGPSNINIGKSEHGTVAVLSDGTAASIAYNAAAQYQSQNNVAGNFCINQPNCQNAPLTVGVLPGFAGNISTQQVASIGLSYGAGHDSVLAGCYQAPQQCWPPAASAGELFMYYNGAGSFGQLKLIQSQDNGAEEVSVGYCSGCAQAGEPPVFGPVNGANGFWSAGINNTSISAGPQSGNFNNRYFLFNAGLVNSIYVGIGTVNTDSTGKNITLNTGTFSGLAAAQTVIINNNQCVIAAFPPVTGGTFSCTASVGTSLTNVGLNAIRQGGFPFQVSPADGMARVNYGLGFGSGPDQAYTSFSEASLYSTQNLNNVLFLGTGAIPTTTVNTSGTTVSWSGGPNFTTLGLAANQVVFIKGTGYAITGSVTSTSFGVTSSIGTLWGVALAAQPQGELKLGQAVLSPSAFSTAFACNAITAGTIQFFPDSTTQTWGATITGGGSLPAFGGCDGANWTVIGK